MTEPVETQPENPVSTDQGSSEPISRVCPQGLLLDFGSVISVSFFERHRETEQLLGIPQGTLTWLGPLDPATDELWQAMQRDEVTERDYWAARATEIGKRVGESGWDMQMLLNRVRQTDPERVVRSDIALLIRDARMRGIKVGILSNELELFYGRPFLMRLALIKQVDALIDCTHSGILKPDPRAYARAIEVLHLEPEQVLFVDDQFRNIAGAVRVGLQTQHFDLRDVEGVTAALRARLRLDLV